MAGVGKEVGAALLPETPVATCRGPEEGRWIRGSDREDRLMPQKILFVSPQPFFQWRGSPIRVSFDVQALAELGFEVEPSSSRGSFGRIHAIGYDAVGGLWIGVADPDWEGSAEGPVRSP